MTHNNMLNNSPDAWSKFIGSQTGQMLKPTSKFVSSLLNPQIPSNGLHLPHTDINLQLYHICMQTTVQSWMYSHVMHKIRSRAILISFDQPDMLMLLEKTHDQPLSCDTNTPPIDAAQLDTCWACLSKNFWVGNANSHCPWLFLAYGDLQWQGRLAFLQLLCHVIGKLASLCCADILSPYILEQVTILL